MKLKRLKEWLKRKVKKYKKDDIQTAVTGSRAVEIDEINPFEEKEREQMIETLMNKIMDIDFFKETFEQLASQPITMLTPYEGNNAFYLFSPTLQTHHMVRAPTEAVPIEESNGKETLCLIHNVPYLVPDEYLKTVGYN